MKKKNKKVTFINPTVGKLDIWIQLKFEIQFSDNNSFTGCCVNNI